MTLFSQDWRLLARKYVLFHAGTRNSSQIIPQDEDLHLVYLRACAWNIEQYWKCADSMRELVTVCDKVIGFSDEDGSPLLEDQSSKFARLQAIKRWKAKCGCGKTQSSGPCCIPTRCGCATDDGRRCSTRCSCDPARCQNNHPASANFAGVAGNSTSSIHNPSANHPSSIYALLNDDSSDHMQFSSDIERHGEDKDASSDGTDSEEALHV